MSVVHNIFYIFLRLELRLLQIGMIENFTRLELRLLQIGMIENFTSPSKRKKKYETYEVKGNL